MASTSKNQTIQDSPVGAAIQGDNTNIQKIIVNNQNLVADFKKPDFKVPRCIESFHGREDKIKELDTLFFKNNKTKIVIHGLPGFGKTEMSKQFAKHCELNREIKHTFWIEAENEDKLQQACKELHKNYDKYQNVPCLYIFDNAVSRSSLFEYEPESEQHLTLITSVDGNWSNVVPVQLDSLPLKEAAKLLKTISNCGDELNNESFEELANAVSCVPLGLQIVGGFVREEQMCLGHSFKLDHYVKKIKVSQFDVLHKNIPTSAGNTYKKTIFNAMTESIDKIRNSNDNRADLALNILYVCAFTNPDCTYVNDLLQIPNVQELVQYNSSDSDNFRNSISNRNSNNDSDSNSSIGYMSFEDLTDDSKVLLKHAIGLLINLSFITYCNIYKDSITLHRLTQSFLRDYLKLRNLTEKYLTDCLYTFNSSSFFFLSYSVLSYCEEYSDIVQQFFKTQNTKFKQINILKKLVEYGFVDCLEKIFKCSTENLIEFVFICFSISSKHNQFKILELLLEYININSTNEDGDTILHIVAKTGNIESIKFLIGRGANVIAKNKAGDTPLFVLAKFVKYSEDVDWGSILEIFQYNKDLTNNNNETLLHIAAIEKQPNLVKELILKHNININQTDLTNRTPIDYIFSQLWLYNERLYLTGGVLLKYGAKSNDKLEDEDGMFEFMFHVVENEDLELLECALQQRCDVHCRNINKSTLLHRAADNGNLKIIKLLISKGLNINSVNAKNETAAFNFVRYVVEYNISDMNLVKEALDLLNCREQTRITNNTYGNNMLHIAAIWAHKDLVQLLIKRYKFKVNQRNNDGDTPLHNLMYATKDVKHIVEILIKAGADLNITNNKQETPLQILHRINKNNSYNNTYLIPLLTRRKTCCNVM